MQTPARPSASGSSRGCVRQLYGKLPPSFRRALQPLANLLQCRHLLRMEFHTLTGTHTPDDTPLTILCAADAKNRAYLAEVFFNSPCRDEPLGRMAPWQAPSRAKRAGHDCALMILNIAAPLRRFLRPNHWFCIPTWMSAEIEIPLPAHILGSSSLKSDLRRIRNRALTYELTRDPGRFADFYNNMYVPHITAMHGPSAYLVPQEEMAARLPTSDLLIVCKEGLAIAGCLIVYDPDGPRMWSLGIRPNPDGDYLVDGASSALYLFAIEHLGAKGFTRMGMGLSRAFLNDGILRYKQKWGLKIIGADPNFFALRILNPAAAEPVLQSHPFIFTQNGEFISALFRSTPAPCLEADLRALATHHLVPGLAKLIIYRPEKAIAAAPDAPIPPDLATRIAYRPFSVTNA